MLKTVSHMQTQFLSPFKKKIEKKRKKKSVSEGQCVFNNELMTQYMYSRSKKKDTMVFISIQIIIQK